MGMFFYSRSDRESVITYLLLYQIDFNGFFFLIYVILTPLLSLFYL